MSDATSIENFAGGSSRRHVVGCMTGTSLDGLDVALVEIVGHGLSMTARCVAHHQASLAPIAQTLASLASGQPHAPIDYMRAARHLGVIHAQAIAEMLAQYQANRDTDMSTGETRGGNVGGNVGGKVGGVDLVVAHGQTIWHAPDDRLSWQLFDPWPIVRTLGVPVCHDLRQADLVAGGQGAPITPMSDWVMFRDGQRTRAIVNLGGIINVTWLPKALQDCDTDSEQASLMAAIKGGDVGPCNLLLDGLVQRLWPGERYDDQGKHAAKGQAIGEVVDAILSHPALQETRGRSLGREDFNADWLDGLVEQFAPLASSAPHDLLASAVSAVVKRLRSQLHGVDEIVLAGGGVRNRALHDAMMQVFGDVPVRISDELGVPVELRESIAMAVLGALSQDGVPITMPQVTDANRPGVAGVYAGLCGSPRRTAMDESDSATRPTDAPIEDQASDLSTTPAPVVEATASRGHLMTEHVLPDAADLDVMSIEEVLRLINNQDAQVASAVMPAIPELAQLVEHIANRMRRGGRLIYIGAGTSGRLGVLDASECPPTFCTDPSQVIGIIAGGDGALRRSSESREDDPKGAADELSKHDVGANDVLVGIAAGGTTPYVLGAITMARSRGALTALLCCVSPDHVATDADHVIALPVGPEIVTGSTRMKSGTATKLALNMISTATMVALGKTYGSLMVDVRATNAKLVDRALRIIMRQTGLDRDAADMALQRSGKRVKTALVMVRRDVRRESAEQLLAEAGGRLREVIGPPRG